MKSFMCPLLSQPSFAFASPASLNKTAPAAIAPTNSPLDLSSPLSTCVGKLAQCKHLEAMGAMHLFVPIFVPLELQSVTMVVQQLRAALSKAHNPRQHGASSGWTRGGKEGPFPRGFVLL